MASFLNANFDSEDEEDDDYVVTDAEKKQAMKEEGVAQPAKPKRGSKRGRGIPAPRADAGTGQDAEDGSGDDDDAEEEPEQPRLVLPKPGQAAAKRAKIEAVWQALNSRDMGGSNACKPPSSSISLAALCGRSKEQNVPTPELTWQRQLGLMAPQLQRNIFPKPSDTASRAGDAVASASAPEAGSAASASTSAQATASTSTAAAEQVVAEVDAKAGQGPSNGWHVSEEAKAGAAAALAAAKEAASLGSARSYNKVAVTQTRRFAGQDVQVTVQVDKDSKDAQQDVQKGAAPAASGLDRFLAELEKKKKVNILDKSKMDWNQLKSADANMEEELEAHKRSNKKYLDKVEFLKKAELREYEIERDKRLAGDVRLRNRL